jgi:hypothetical protein
MMAVEMIHLKKHLILGGGFAALTIAAVALGCTQVDTVKVVVPQGFQGKVMVPCFGVASGNRTVNVDAMGHAENTDCPKDESHVVVVRGGVIMKPQAGVVIQKTGDGIPVGFGFDVK